MMKSKTLSFNLAIILTNLKRFWWTSALYVIIGFLTGPLTILRTDIEYYIERGREIRLNNILGTNALFLCFAIHLGDDLHYLSFVSLIALRALLLRLICIDCRALLA